MAMSFVTFSLVSVLWIIYGYTLAFGKDIAGIIGAGLLWFGWFGFNAGSALGANGIAGVAFINTNTATAMAGVFADPLINESGKGLLYGNSGQLLIQMIAVGTVIIYDLVVTIIIFLIIKSITGIRVDCDDEIIGLDESQHGEKSYNLYV